MHRVAACYPFRVRSFLFPAGLLVLLSMLGCHSKYVETTITNGSAKLLTVIQVEYPSASFGVQTLPPGQSFHYRFKLYGTGPLKLTFFDAKAQEHHQVGPVLTEGQEGQLTIAFPAQDHATFQMRLRP